MERGASTWTHLDTAELMNDPSVAQSQTHTFIHKQFLAWFHSLLDSIVLANKLLMELFSTSANSDLCVFTLVYIYLPADGWT